MPAPNAHTCFASSYRTHNCCGRYKRVGRRFYLRHIEVHRAVFLRIYRQEKLDSDVVAIEYRPAHNII
jgi:hypothetical protein